jgi:uncharacterized protein (DUF1800 family)
MPDFPAQDALHLLNRLTWGVRAVDVAKLQNMGKAAFLEQQLRPENLPDPAVRDFMGKYPILSAPYPNLLRAVEKDDNYQIYYDFIWARMYRAAYSERQLFERMVEFWTDHFNVPTADELIADKIWDDREVIRRHAMGKFRDLLIASASSPAMIQYLNNDDNVKAHPNENYAREVMELHTLGVDGGYTEKDVRELARILTGWTVHEGMDNGFRFDKAEHDLEAKTFLGVKFAAGRGIEEVLQALDLLASHPSTARYISTKLIRRFVNDTPPPSLISSTEKVFLQSGGDIPAVLRHIFNSAEFMASGSSKFRRPIEFVVAAVRTLDLKPSKVGIAAFSISSNPSEFLYDHLSSMGQIPFNWFPPNGYPDSASAWFSTNGLLYRWQFAFDLTRPDAEDDPGYRFKMPQALARASTPESLVDQAAGMVLYRALPEPDRRALIAHAQKQWEDGTPPAAEILSLLIASPHFQWI